MLSVIQRLHLDFTGGPIFEAEMAFSSVCKQLTFSQNPKSTPRISMSRYQAIRAEMPVASRQESQLPSRRCMQHCNTMIAMVAMLTTMAMMIILDIEL